jgi:hypothetical protein
LCWFYIIGITNDHKYSGLKHKLIWNFCRSEVIIKVGIQLK